MTVMVKDLTGKSTSGWRLWIEMSIKDIDPDELKGQPPDGGCGLKFSAVQSVFSYTPSTSGWRLWIEMKRNSAKRILKHVNLRMEVVD